MRIPALVFQAREQTRGITRLHCSSVPGGGPGLGVISTAAPPGYPCRQTPSTQEGAGAVPAKMPER